MTVYDELTAHEKSNLGNAFGSFLMHFLFAPREQQTIAEKKESLVCSSAEKAHQN